MVQRRRPSGFIEPCQPSKVLRPPSGPLWVHEIKHDGYRLMVRRDSARVRCFTRNGHDWADRFPAMTGQTRTTGRPCACALRVLYKKIATAPKPTNKANHRIRSACISIWPPVFLVWSFTGNVGGH
jgi:hypothetical protein